QGRDAPPSRLADEMRIGGSPLRDPGRPILWNFAQRQQARAGILAALGIVRRSRREPMGLRLDAPSHEPGEGPEAETARRRVAAHLGEGEQTGEAVESGILQRLRHHGPGEWLELADEAQDARPAVAG